MADVMLVLLIIFMVVTPMLQKGKDVELARTKNPIDMKEADRDDAIIVAITRDGKFYLGTDQVKVEDLAAKVNDLLTNRLDKKVFVKSDNRPNTATLSRLSITSGMPESTRSAC
jgi:biopolymer transport protein ExbD/biopolymer transport protein TolR